MRCRGVGGGGGRLKAMKRELEDFERLWGGRTEELRFQRRKIIPLFRKSRHRVCLASPEPCLGKCTTTAVMITVMAGGSLRLLRRSPTVARATEMLVLSMRGLQSFKCLAS